MQLVDLFLRVGDVESRVTLHVWSGERLAFSPPLFPTNGAGFSKSRASNRNKIDLGLGAYYIQVKDSKNEWRATS